MASKTVICPKCGSTSFVVVNDGRRPFSLTKGIVGIAIGVPLFGVFGLLGGLLMFLGKKGAATFACHECGNSWQQMI